MMKSLLDVQWNPDYVTLKFGKHEVKALENLIGRSLDITFSVDEFDESADAFGYYLMTVLGNFADGNK